MSAALSVVAASILDRLFGEPRYCHPLVIFGSGASFVEKELNTGSTSGAVGSRIRGLASWCLLVVPLTLAAAAVTTLDDTGIFDALVLYLVLGSRSLEEHALQVRQSLLHNDIENARRKVGYMVSRDTDGMDEVEIAQATAESVLENGNDAVYAPIFWYVVAGAGGAVFYRLANTLDAMWGYRSERFKDFGWACARIDDVLNFIPARMTALTYASLGRFGSAWHCWRRQGGQHDSINAGVVMAAGAGALELQLGGDAVYHGRRKDRPMFGCGKLPGALDIESATRLVGRGLWLWVVLLLLGGWSIA